MGPFLITGNAINAIGCAIATTSIVVQSAPVLVCGLVLISIGAPLYSVSQISIRQTVTPIDLMGRVNASRRFVVFAFLPLGALTGGLIADASTIATGLATGTLFMALAAFIPLFSPLRRRSLDLPA